MNDNPYIFQGESRNLHMYMEMMNMVPGISDKALRAGVGAIGLDSY